MSRNDNIIRYEFDGVDHYTSILNAFKGLYLFTQKVINEGLTDESDKNVNYNCNDMLRFLSSYAYIQAYDGCGWMITSDNDIIITGDVMCNMRRYELEYMLGIDIDWEKEVSDNERLDGTDILVKKRIEWIIKHIINFKEAEVSYNDYLNDNENYNERGKKTKKHFYEISNYTADDLKGCTSLVSKYKDIILQTVALRNWDIENIFVFDDAVDVMSIIAEKRKKENERMIE